MGMFRRKKGPQAVAEKSTVQFRGKVGLWLARQEMSLADYLNQKTKTWNSRQWLSSLIGFCLLAGGYLLSLLWRIFN